MTIDLGPAASRMADLIGGVPDEMLDRPTPCTDTSLGDLIDHVGPAAASGPASRRTTE